MDKEYVLTEEQLKRLEDDEIKYIKTKKGWIGEPLHCFQFENAIIQYTFYIWESHASFDFEIKGKTSEAVIIKASEVIHKAYELLKDFPELRLKIVFGSYSIHYGLDVIENLDEYKKRVNQKIAEKHVETIIEKIDEILNKPRKKVEKTGHKFHYIHMYREDAKQLIDALVERGLATFKKQKDHTYNVYLRQTKKLYYSEGYLVTDEIVELLRNYGFLCFRGCKHDKNTAYIAAAREISFGTNGLGWLGYVMVLGAPILLLLMFLLTLGKWLF